MIGLRQRKLAWASAVRRLFAQPFATLFTTLALGVAISLPVGLQLGLEALEKHAGQLPAQPELTLYMASDAGPAERDALAARLAAQPEIAEHRFVPRDQALAELARSLELGDLAVGLDANPLPDTWIVRTRTSAQLAGLRDALAGLPGVAEVSYDSAWVERLAAAVALGKTGVALAATLFGIALVAVSANAVRAQVLARRDEILVSRLIGASAAIIRRPFVYLGALQGLLGGLAAWGILAAVALAVGAPLTALASLYGADWSLPAPSPDMIAGVLLTTSTLGAMGAWIAVARTLKLVEGRA